MLALVRVWVVASLCGWAVVPLLRRVLGGLPDRGYALARIFGWVACGWIAWILATVLRRPLNPGICLGAFVIVAAICRLPAWWPRARAATGGAGLPETARTPDTRPRWDLILRIEVLFASGLILFGFLESRNPAVDPDSERLMDYAFLRASLRSPGLPIPDPWFAGENAAYYHFGYALVAFLVRAAGTDPSRLFTAALALQYALLWVAAFGLGLALTGRARGGWFTAFFVLGAGNFEWIRQWAAHGVAGFDWFSPSRVIEGAITEVPWFSLLWGDLHAYVIALPIVACALGFVVAEALGQEREATRAGRAAGTAARACCFALLCGALLATHPWDLPILFLAAAAVLLSSGARAFLPRLTVFLVCGTASAFVFLPFLRGLAVRWRGIGMVTQRSAPAEWMMAYGPFLLLGLLAAAAPLLRVGETRRGSGALLPGERLALALAGSAFLTVVACEMVYVRDVFETTGLGRMNTVFKLHRLAWLLLGVAAAPLAGRLLAARPMTAGRVVAARLALAAVIAGALVYPTRGTASWLSARARDAAQQTTEEARAALRPWSDAEALFRALHPGDAEAAAWLDRAVRAGDGVAEESGEAYTWSSRISTFSGVPSILGWGNHEAVWRQGWDEVRRRRDDLEIIFAAPGSKASCERLRHYGAGFLVVGPRERERYGKTVETIRATVPPSFESPGTEVYRVEALCAPSASH